MTDPVVTVAGYLSPVLAAAAVLSGAVALAATRRPALALGVLLDLLVAAGLLRLVGSPDWRTIVTAAVIIGLRHLIAYGLRTGARTWSAGTPGPAHRPVEETVRRLVTPAWRR